MELRHITSPGGEKSLSTAAQRHCKKMAEQMIEQENTTECDSSPCASRSCVFLLIVEVYGTAVFSLPSVPFVSPTVPRDPPPPKGDVCGRLRRVN